MKFFRDLKLQIKVLLMCVTPLLLMCLVAIVINNTVVKDSLVNSTKQELRATAKAVLAAYDQNTGDYFENAAGHLWKGSYNVSLSSAFVDDIQEKTGMAVTFFYGDKRLVTSLRDQKGERITGTKAGDFLVKNVLQDGNEVFTNRVLVEDEFYYGYYVPVRQNITGEVIGMVFAGMPVAALSASINMITTVFAAAIVIIVLFTVIVGTLVSGSIAKNIQSSMNVVQQISEGNLQVQIPENALNRKDEVGALSMSTKKLVDNLSGMLGMIADNTMTLNASSEEMNAAAGQASSAVNNINDNLQSVLTGVETQAENVMSIRQNIENIDSNIEATLIEVDELSDAADKMLKAGNDVGAAFHHLEASNKDVLKEIENIQNQTMQTNQSVEMINRAVALIADIADQTNLLSLNASIEAARAGEAGRGFGVVAEEIGALANQSNQASAEISQMIDQLSQNSELTIEIMDAVQKAINDQSQSVTNTAEIFGQVQGHITRVASGVEVIRESTKKLGKDADSIAHDIKNLSDIAENSEDTVKSVITYSDEVQSTVNGVHDMSTEVSSSANDMAGVISKFRV